MKKFLAVLLLSLVVSSSAWAGGIETTTLFDRKSNPDTSRPYSSGRTRSRKQNTSRTER